jgi:Tfp pilus assembly protein PilF
MDKKQRQSKKQNHWWFIAGFVIVIVFGIFLSGCAPSDENQKEAEDKVAQAQLLLADRYYIDALKMYEEARTIDPGNADIYTGIADIYILKNRVEDAREVLEVGSWQSREPSSVYVDLGWLEIGEENADLAVSYCKTAARSDSENYEARYCLAEAYVESGDFENAADELDIPEAAGGWYVRGKILEAVLAWDDTDLALEAIGSALKGDSDNGEAEETADLIRQNLNEFEKIDEETLTDVHRDVVLSYNALIAGYEDIVISKMEPYAEDNSQYWDLFSYLGQAYYLDGDVEKAESYLSEAVSLNPSDPYSAWYLARVSSDRGKSTEADSLYKRAISLSPDGESKEIREEYVGFLMENGQYAEAADQLEKLDENAETDEIHYRYALMRVESFINRELYDDAAEILESMGRTEPVALASGPLAGEYRWAQAEVEYANGNREEALSLVDSAINHGPAEPRYHLLRGQLLFELGQSEDAEKALERAIDLDLDGEVSAEAVKVLDRI